MCHKVKCCTPKLFLNISKTADRKEDTAETFLRNILNIRGVDKI